MAGALSSPCIFCQIARASTPATILHRDDKVVAFQDINPSALRHYLVIPVEHIPTVKQLRRGSEDFALVSNMLDVGRALLQRDAPHAVLPEGIKIYQNSTMANIVRVLQFILLAIFMVSTVMQSSNMVVEARELQQGQKIELICPTCTSDRDCLAIPGCGVRCLGSPTKRICSKI